MLRHALGNANLANGHPEVVHQVDGVVIGAVGGAKARHGYAHYALAVELQLIEGLHANQQGQRGVESTADAHHHVLGMGMDDALGESHDLYVENLLTRLSHGLIRRRERLRFYVALQHKVAQLRRLGLDKTDVLTDHAALRVHKCGVVATVGPEALHVDLGLHDLRFQRETLAFGQATAILVNQGVATIHHVLCALAKACRAIHICAHGACALLCEQTGQVLMLAQKLIGSREVEHDVGTRQGQVVAGRCRGPHVLTNLHTKHGAIGRAEELGGGSQRHHVARIAYGHLAQVLQRGKPALLIKLIVIGEIGLGNNAQDLAFLKHNTTVEQQAARHDGGAHNADDVQLAREVEQGHHAVLGSVEQQLLAKEVLTRIARDAQLWKHDDFHAAPFSLGYDYFHLLCVLNTIGNLHRRHSRGHFDKSVLHIINSSFIK